jgi:hypothetical protein
MRQVDRVMIEDLGIELIQMMENAGLHLAELARSRFSRLQDVPVTVLAGGGNNGGGGLVRQASRQLGSISERRSRPTPERDHWGSGSSDEDPPSHGVVIP